MRRSLAALALAVVLPLPSLAPAAALANVVVRSGETLSEIAERHGVSLTRLMQANGITNPNLVVAGQKLVLPGARSTAAASGGARSGSITVQPGETLSEIAARQGVSLTQLMQANGITNPNLVVAGQKLVVPGARSSASAAAPRPLPTAPYTIKSGETLSEIAERFGTSTERLIQLNQISDPNMVVAGTRLAIPGRPSSAPAARSSATPRNAKEHVVRSGENLSTIADSYGLTVEKLVAINKISDPNMVVSGTRLKLQAPPPVKAPAKAAAKAPAQAAAKPVAQPKPKPVVTPAAQSTATVQPTPQATPQPAAAAPAAAQAVATAQPTSRIAAATTGTAATAATTAVAAATATPQTATPKPATSKPVNTATRAATTTRPSTTSKAGSSKPQGPDWRSYGPLQVDWANWQPMGGSYVAPTLNGDGKPVYLAVNCGARKLNATSQSGQWKSWDAPQTDFEEQLISDICKARGS
jgi:LysM repeat protein